MGLHVSTTIVNQIEQFTGRAWLLPRILEWLQNSSERFFLLTAAPGAGKSMVIAWLAGHGPTPADSVAQTQLEQLRDQVKAANFCQANARVNSPKDFADNITRQLTQNVPGFGEALVATLEQQVRIIATQTINHMAAGARATNIYIEHLDLDKLSDDQSFDRAFVRPLKKLYANGYQQPLLLLIDALDEAQSDTEGKALIDLLTKLTDLPLQVRILATTRPDPRISKLFRSARTVDLIQDAATSEKGVDDIHKYVIERVKAHDAAFDPERRTILASRISQAAEGIFLYARMVLDDLLPRLPEIPNLADFPLPKDLSGLYHEFLNRELGKDEERWQDYFKPLLGLIAVAQAPGLTLVQIQKITGKDVEREVRICKQYLNGDLPKGALQPFHQSFVDFLLNDPTNVDYHIARITMHRQIADHYRGTAISWDMVDWHHVDDYGLQHIAAHLHALREDNKFQFELYKLICKPFMDAQFNRTQLHNAFLHDTNLAINVALHYEPPNLAQGVRCCLVHSTLISLTINALPAVLAALVKVDQEAKACELAALTKDSYNAYSTIARTLLICGKLTERFKNVLEATVMATERKEGRDGEESRDDIIRGELYRAKNMAVAAFAEKLGVKKVDSQNKYTKSVESISKTLAVIQKEWSKITVLDELGRRSGEIGAKDVIAAAETIKDEVTRVELIEEIVRIQIQAEQFAEALSLAETMQSVPKIEELTREIFRGQIRREQIDEAITTAERIRNEKLKSEALGVKIKVLVKIGDFGQAVALATSIVDEWSKWHALAGIAQSQAQAGLIDEAEEMTAKIGDKHRQADALYMIALALLRAGNFDRLLILARAIGNEYYKDEILKRLANALVHAQETGRALSLVDEIPDAERQVGFLNTLAQDLASAQKHSQARELFKKAAAIAQGILETSSKALKLQEIALGLTEIGEISDALTIAAWLEDDKVRAEALKKIASALTDATEIGRVLIMVGQISDSDAKADILKKASALMARLGAIQEALELGEQIEVQWVKTKALGEIAILQAKGGDLNGALQLVEDRVEPLNKWEPLVSIANALAEAGDTERALEIIATIENETVRARVTAGTIRTHAMTAQPDQTIRLIHEYGLPKQKLKLLRELALMKAQNGDKVGAARVLQHAQLIAEGITTEWEKAEWLEMIFGAQIEMGEIDQAMHMVENVQDEKKRASFLVGIARARVGSGEFDKALSIAEKIREKESILYDIIRSRVKRHEFGEALIAARQIEKEEVRVTYLNSITNSIAVAEDQTKAEEALDQAILVTDTIKDRWHKLVALAEIAWSLKRIGAKAKAKEVADSVNAILTIALTQTVGIGRDGAKINMLLEVTQCLVQGGKFDQAMAVATQIGSATRHDWLVNPIIERIRAKEFDIALAMLAKLADQGRKAEVLTKVAHELAQTGEFDLVTAIMGTALSEVDRTTDAHQKAYLLADLAQTVAQAGEVDRAVNIADKIGDEGRKAGVLSKIAHGLAQAGEVDRAVNIADKIGDEGRKAGVLSKIAYGLAQAGEAHLATEVAQKAMTGIDKIEDQFWKDNSLRDIALTLTHIGSHELAVKEAANIGSQYEKRNVLNKIARTLTHTGNYDEAIAVTDSFEEQYEKAEAFSEIAHRLTQAGNYVKAMSLAEKLETYRRTPLLRRVAHALAEAQAYEQARSVAEQILNSDQDRVGALMEIAQIQFQSGAHILAANTLEQAEMVADKIDGRYGTVDMLLQVAQVMGQCGQQQRATEILMHVAKLTDPLGTFDNDRPRDRRLQKNVSLLALLGEFERAEQVANMMGGDERAEAKIEIVKAFAQIGKTDAAISVAEQITRTRYKAIALKEIGNACSLANEHTKALTILKHAATVAGTSDDAAHVCKEIAEGLVRIGEVDEALVAAQKIIDKGRKATTLKAIAAAVVNITEEKHALRLLSNIITEARSLSRNDFFLVLEGAVSALAKFSPSVLWEVYQAVQAVDSWWDET